MNRVKGKVAIVTGAASGMGAADIRVLAEEGAEVVAADLNRDLLDDVVAQLAGDGLAVSAVTLDVADRAGWDEAVAFAERTYGDVSVLVNNAGIVQKNRLEDTDPEVWDRITGVNQRGVLYGMQAVVPGMRRRGGGSIVNIASIQGIIASRNATAYHASKGAVRSMTRAVATQLGPDNIRVNSVNPGTIETSIVAGLRASGHNFSGQPDITPLRRFGQAREIATAVLFLASDESSYITGTDLVVDGGLIARR